MIEIKMAEMEKREDGTLLCKNCCGVEDVIIQYKERYKHLEDFHDWKKK